MHAARLRSAGTAAKSGQNLDYLGEEAIGPLLPMEHLVKILIRPHGCAG